MRGTGRFRPPSFPLCCWHQRIQVAFVPDDEFTSKGKNQKFQYVCFSYFLYFYIPHAKGLSTNEYNLLYFENYYISLGEASITTSEADAVVYSEQSNTVESLETPSGTLISQIVDGNHNGGGENYAVLDQATNGLNSGEDKYWFLHVLDKIYLMMYIEDITQWREDEFYVWLVSRKWAKWMSEIFLSQRVMFFYYIDRYYRIELKAQTSNKLYMNFCSLATGIPWISLFFPFCKQLL